MQKNFFQQVVVFDAKARSRDHCLRVVTGCHAAASMEHVHHETKTLPVVDHLQLLSRQFLASAFNERHPSFGTVTSISGPRPLRHTLRSRHLSAVAPFLRDGVLPLESRQDVLKELHTDAVTAAIQKLDENPNRVLNARPPPVHQSEGELPRHWRTTLSQLRSGFCCQLNNYKSMLDRQTLDV